MPSWMTNGTDYFLDTKLGYSNAAVVFVTAVAREAFDRTDLEVRPSPRSSSSLLLGGRALTPSSLLQLEHGGSDLVENVAARHADTVVVVTAPGPVDMSRLVDHPNVTAILYTYFGGQEGCASCYLSLVARSSLSLTPDCVLQLPPSPRPCSATSTRVASSPSRSRATCPTTRTRSTTAR